MSNPLRPLTAFALALVLASSAARAADLLEGIPSEEAAFLEALFALTDEAALLDANTLAWFASDGEQGLHPAVHAARAEALRERLAQLEAPPRLAAVHGYISEARRLQGEFLAEWHAALREGRPFQSQISDEYAYHAGLHRSRRMLLKAFAELRALHPSAGEPTQNAFRRHLRALDLH